MYIIYIDASLVHYDFADGNNFTPQQDLLEKFQSFAGDKDYLNLNDIISYRNHVRPLPSISL